MNQKIKPFYFFLIALFLSVGFASMIAVAKNDNSNGGGSDKDKKVENSAKDEDKKNSQNVSIDLKNYKKADTSKGETNAQIHKEKTAQVIERLEQEKVKDDSVSVDIKVGKTEVNVEAKNKAKKQITQVVAEQEASQETVSEAIEEVENDGVAKKFFLGPDYKNLGQLRSELVYNRNQIRQLNQAIATLSQNGEDTIALKEQLVTLTQERERIKSIILTNQESFSLFGWVSRFLANYEKTPINEEEEDELIQETQETIDDVNGETAVEIDTNTGITPGTGATTDTTTGTTTVTTSSTETTVNTTTTENANTTTGDNQIDTTVILTR